MTYREQLKIIQFGSSHKIGLTNQETELALSYHALNKFRLLVISGEDEQLLGCHDKLNRAGISTQKIKGLDEHQDIFRLIQDFSRQVEIFSPDIVTVNTNWQLVIVGISRFINNYKYKIVYTVHGFRHNYKFRSIIAIFLISFILLLFADKVNAPTSFVAKRFLHLSKLVVKVPLGEDDLYFVQNEKPEFGGSLFFCFAGEFRKGKNQISLIRTFKRYLEVSGDRGARLYLPGKGPLRSRAQDYAVELGISGSVIFPGQLDRGEMLELYRMCQVALVPTNIETFGHCIAEPMILGRIVISRPVGVAVDVINDGNNGFIFHNSDELLDKMLLVKNSSKEFLEQISSNAKKSSEQFKWKKIAQRHFSEIFSPFFQH